MLIEKRKYSFLFYPSIYSLLINSRSLLSIAIMDHLHFRIHFFFIFRFSVTMWFDFFISLFMSCSCCLSWLMKFFSGYVHMLVFYFILRCHHLWVVLFLFLIFTLWYFCLEREMGIIGWNKEWEIYKKNTLKVSGVGSFQTFLVSEFEFLHFSWWWSVKWKTNRTFWWGNGSNEPKVNLQCILF
jgi:hypothetical protein